MHRQAADLSKAVHPCEAQTPGVRAIDEERPPEKRRGGLSVLMIVESSAAGTGRHVMDLAQCLIERGCDVHLVYSTGRIDRTFINRLAELKGLHQLAVPMRTAPHLTDLKALWTIRRYMKSAGPFDLIHGHSSKGGALARLAAIGTGIPAFYTLHGLIMMDPIMPRWKWLFYLSIELGLSLGTARVIAVSPEEARAAVRLGFGKNRVIVVPNGLRPAPLAPRAQARQLIGVDDNAVVVGFVGRLVEQKAPHVLIHAFAATAAVFPFVRLAMVGAGPLQNSLRKLADELNVNDKIIWLGERDARGVFAGFDIFAISSQREGLPYVVLEAMAAGLPVVATSSSGVEVLVKPGINGAIVATDDVAAFAAALLQLVSNPKRLAECGHASLKLASQFTVERMGDQTLDAYRSQIREARPS